MVLTLSNPITIKLTLAAIAIMGFFSGIGAVDTVKNAVKSSDAPQVSQEILNEWKQLEPGQELTIIWTRRDAEGQLVILDKEQHKK